MTDHTETLIKATLQRQADRAVDPSVLFAGLETARSPRRTGRLLVGAAAVVVLVLVAGIFLVKRDQSTPVATTPPPAPAKPTYWQPGMTYEPAWLPDGVVEKSRSSGVNWVARSWEPPYPQHGPIVGLSVSDYVPPIDTKHSRAISVNDVPGQIVSRNGVTDVFWQPKPRIWVLVTVTELGEPRLDDIAVHVAKAVRSGGTKQLRPLLEFGWCPYHDVMTDTGGNDPAHAGGIFKCERHQKPSADVTITVNPSPAFTTGDKVTVRGRQGWYSEKWGVSAPMGDGRYLLVAGRTSDPKEKPWSKADLIRVADTLVIHDAAYVDWIGTR